MVKQFLPAVVLVLFAVVESRADTITYNAVADFSSTVNTETSAWSYRYSSNDIVRDGSYLLLPFGGSLWDPDTVTWRVPSGFQLIGVNKTGHNVTSVTVAPFTWPNNTILMHPDGLENPPVGAGLVVLSWLAPSPGGTINIDYRFKDMDPNGGDGVDWFIDRGSSTGNLAFGTLFNSDTGSQQINNVAVGSGDRINFVVSPRASLNHEFDSTQLTATITFTAVPEPHAFSLVFTAAVAWGIAVFARGRRRRSCCA